MSNLKGIFLSTVGKKQNFFIHSRENSLKSYLFLRLLKVVRALKRVFFLTYIVILKWPLLPSTDNATRCGPQDFRQMTRQDSRKSRLKIS